MTLVIFENFEIVIVLVGKFQISKMHSGSLSQIALPNGIPEFLHSGRKCWTLDSGRSQETFAAESIPSIAIGSRLVKSNSKEDVLLEVC